MSCEDMHGHKKMLLRSDFCDGYQDCKNNMDEDEKRWGIMKRKGKDIWKLAIPEIRCTPCKNTREFQTLYPHFSLGIPLKSGIKLGINVWLFWEFPSFYCFWHEKLGIPIFKIFLLPFQNFHFLGKNTCLGSNKFLT